MSMAKFNVTLIQPDGYLHSLALLEAGEYIHYEITKAGYQSLLTKNYLDSNSINIVLGAHLAPDQINQIKSKLIIFNSEQLPEDSLWTSLAYRNLLENHYVWDYSQENINRVNHNKINLINFYYCDRLHRLTPLKNPEFDLIFYGSMNERRALIIQDLESEGLKVKTLFGVYGVERDQCLINSRAVLNLHYYDAQIFQQIRAFYPLINNIPVISENYPHATAPEIYEKSVFKNEGQLIKDYVINILKDDEKFRLESTVKLSKFKNFVATDSLSKRIPELIDSVF